MSHTQGTLRSRDLITFGVPLIARSAAADWARINDLLALTLRSVMAQTDPRFRLILVGHDVPPCWHALVADDPRFRFVLADWSAGSPSPANADAGCKRWRIKETVREEGGGLMMYLDADDLVDRHLVETAQRMVGGERIGGVIENGFAIDFDSQRAARLPDARVFDGGFHRLCGSSTIARVEPDSVNPVRYDPHEELGSHHVWLETAAEKGVELARLPVVGGYLVNTGENHSENHGPFARWRRDFNRAVRSVGAPLGEDILQRFGLTRDMFEARTGRHAS